MIHIGAPTRYPQTFVFARFRKMALGSRSIHTCYMLGAVAFIWQETRRYRHRQNSSNCWQIVLCATAAICLPDKMTSAAAKL